MMLAPCAQATAESIREALDSLQRLKVSKWNYSEPDVIKSCKDRDVRFRRRSGHDHCGMSAFAVAIGGKADMRFCNAHVGF
jgi:hypothetical protein